MIFTFLNAGPGKKGEVGWTEGLNQDEQNKKDPSSRSIRPCVFLADFIPGYLNKIEGRSGGCDIQLRKFKGHVLMDKNQTLY